MPNFVFSVTETVVWERSYVVEAADLAEATEKAERGETVSEEDIKLEGVTNRQVLAGGLLITGDFHVDDGTKCELNWCERDHVTKE